MYICVLTLEGDKRRGHIEVVLMSSQDICIEAKKNKKKKNKVCKILPLSFIRINGEKGRKRFNLHFLFSARTAGFIRSFAGRSGKHRFRTITTLKYLTWAPPPGDYLTSTSFISNSRGAFTCSDLEAPALPGHRWVTQTLSVLHTVFIICCAIVCGCSTAKISWNVNMQKVRTVRYFIITGNYILCMVKTKWHKIKVHWTL